MRRTTLLVWGSVAVMGVLTLTLVGLWLAVRWYPEQAGPHLPPGIAFRMAGWGKQERRAAQICFGSDPRAISHKGLCSLTAEQIARRNAILCAALRGSRDDQVFALEFIAGANTGFAPASAERNALVYALISSPDEALRMIARDRWIEDGANYFDRLTTLTFDPATDRSPLAPDGWIAGPAAIDAWLALIYLSAGYDHSEIPTTTCRSVLSSSTAKR